MKAVALLLCLVAWTQVVLGQTNTNCPPPDPFRIRDCSPWGIDDPDNINPAFQYSWPNEDAIDKCTGVINMFYFFKITIYGQQLETSVLMWSQKAIANVLWNINAHFHPKWMDTLGMLARSPKRRLVTPANTKDGIRKRNIALAFGLARVASFVTPFAEEDINAVLDLLVAPAGLNHKDKSRNIKTPQGIGNVVAAELIEYLKGDGWNALGKDKKINTKDDFADYTGFKPVNSWNKMSFPASWQPLKETTNCGKEVIQIHTTPQCRSPKIKPFAVDKKLIASRKGRGTGFTNPLKGDVLKWYIGNATELIRIQATLTDQQKLIAEFFDKKVISFGGIERWMAYKNKWCHNDWIKYEQMGACFHDATVLAWKEKIRTNGVRPVSAIRYLAAKGLLPKKVQGYAGPNKGLRTILTSNWKSYLRTMPHSEYPSGTSCICSVFTEWTRKFLKNGRLDLTVSWKKGCSLTEPGKKNPVPKKPFSRTWGTLSELMDECQSSRQWAGVHFKNSLKDGKALCSGLADRCYAKVQRLEVGKL